MRSYGFTLLELLISLTVISILLGIGIPSFSAQLQRTRLETATSTMLDALALARTRAISTNARTTMHSTSDWQEGWDVFVDSNNNGRLDGTELVIQHHEKLTGVTISGNKFVKDNISYVGSGEARNANGSNNAGAFQAGTLTICPTEKGEGSKLILARGGRIRQEKMSAADCENI